MANESASKWAAPQVTTPCLVLFVLAAMHLSRYLLAGADSATNLLLDISIIQLLVLVLPCMLYYMLKGRKLSSPMFLSPIAPRHIPLLLFSAMLLVIGGLFIKFGYQAFAAKTVDTSGFFSELIGKTGEYRPAGILLALVLIPAVCEELFFRGVVLSEYRSKGEANAIFVSAICFAMLHFSVSNFPIYLFAGLLLGVVTVASRSILPAILLHVLNNILSVYTSDQFLRIILQKNGAFFVGFLLTVLFGFALFLFLYSIEHLYARFAVDPPMESIPPKSRAHWISVYLSPTFIILTVAFILLTALR